MADLLKVILPTFSVIIIGFIFGKWKKPDMAAVAELVFYLGLPAIAFTSVIANPIKLADASKIWASALIVMIGCGITAWFVFKAIKQKHSGLYIPIFMMNTVNIPFPIIYLVYGAEGLFAATLFYIPNVLAMYTVGISIASGKNWKDSLKEVLKVPALYGAIAGLVVNFAHIPVPDLVVKPISFIGLMVLPLVLIILGVNLSAVRLNSIPTTLLASFLRLGVGLALGVLAVNIFHLTGILKAVVILDSAMPAAANTSMLTTRYNNESEIVSSVVFVTTLASLIIIPLLLHALS